MVDLRHCGCLQTKTLSGDALERGVVKHDL
jgi:hypothetical protein